MQPPGASPVERRQQRRHRRGRAAAPEPHRRVAASGAIAALAVALYGCTTPAPVATPSAAESAPVVRTPLPEAPVATPRAPSAAVVVPPGVQYVCVVDTGSERRQTTIEFAPKVADLCARHPEMGPCQYERNLCRRGGGRVYAAGGVEITTATEAEYDRKVMRVRFKAN
jgi:hypothetical protein